MYRATLHLAAMVGLMQAVVQENQSGGAATAHPKGIDPNVIKIDTNLLANPVSFQLERKLSELKEGKFTFRTIQVPDPDLGLDDKGQPKTKDFKRPTLTVQIPLLTKAGVIAALSADDKTTELVIDAVNAQIQDRARAIINDKIDVDPNIVLKIEDLPIEQLSLAAIASLPKSERGAGLAKELFQAFVADYKVMMQSPEAIALFSDKKPRSPDILEKHAILLAGKFNQVKSRKDVVGQMQGFLDVWAQVTPNLEEHSQVYEFLQSKANAIMQGESFDDL